MPIFKTFSITFFIQKKKAEICFLNFKVTEAETIAFSSEKFIF
jgi:hypothetical protein